MVVIKFLYFLRNLRSGKLFKALEQYCHGEVLDVGGSDFFLALKKRSVRFDTWTVLELSTPGSFNYEDQRVRLIVGNGCSMQFENASFDTVLCIQVLEHVFEPETMVREIARVLKKAGHGIFLIPQTGALHRAPHHYYNFTSYWVKEVMRRSELEIIEIKPLGGIFSSMASHSFYFFLQSIRFKGMSSKENKRNLLFYFLYPLMVLHAGVNIILCLILSLGDLSEEPNNHLVVVRKKL